jgi:hypothetical protein
MEIGDRFRSLRDAVAFDNGEKVALEALALGRVTGQV